MFTGLVEEQGKVVSLKVNKDLAVLSVKAKKISAGTKLGDSIAVNGVCLTVTAKTIGQLTFDMVRETLNVTTLKNLKRGISVNLERALRAGDRIGGHFVTGHIDAVGRVAKVIKQKDYVEFRIEIPSEFSRFIVPKGSIAVDGVSLTVGQVRKRGFSIYLIPFTLKVTTFGRLKSGDHVNLEMDLLAKYVSTRRAAKQNLSL